MDILAAAAAAAAAALEGADEGNERAHAIRGVGMSPTEKAVRAIAAAGAGATGDFKAAQASDAAAAINANKLLPVVAEAVGVGGAVSSWPPRALSSNHSALKEVKKAGADAPRVFPEYAAAYDAKREADKSRDGKLNVP